MPLVGVKAPDAVEGTEASVPTLGVKGFWPWAFAGWRNTSLAPAAVLFPVRAKPRPAPAPITARITRPIRTRLPVRTPPCVCPPSPPPVAAGERVGDTVSSGDATNPARSAPLRRQVVGGKRFGRRRRLGRPRSCRGVPEHAGLLGLELLFAEDTAVVESDEPFELLSSAHVTPPSLSRSWRSTT